MVVLSKREMKELRRSGICRHEPHAYLTVSIAEGWHFHEHPPATIGKRTTKKYMAIKEYIARRQKKRNHSKQNAS
jgi:hypothetical protein